jgi:hypothetical protein
MDYAALPPHLAEEYRLNLARDGGRRVMFGGDPYEDDLEPAHPKFTHFISSESSLGNGSGPV